MAGNPSAYLRALNDFFLIPGEHRTFAIQEILSQANLDGEIMVPSHTNLEDATPLDELSLNRLQHILEQPQEVLIHLIHHLQGRRLIGKFSDQELDPPKAILRKNQFKEKFLLMAMIQESDEPEVLLRTSLITNRLKNEYGASSTNASAQVNSLIDQGYFVEYKGKKVGHKDKLFELTEWGSEQARELLRPS